MAGSGGRLHPITLFHQDLATKLKNRGFIIRNQDPFAGHDYSPPYLTESIIQDSFSRSNSHTSKGPECPYEVIFTYNELEELLVLNKICHVWSIQKLQFWTKRLCSSIHTSHL